MLLDQELDGTQRLHTSSCGSLEGVYSSSHPCSRASLVNEIASSPRLYYLIVGN